MADSIENKNRNDEFLHRLEDAKADADGTIGGPMSEPSDDEWRLGKVVVFKEILCVKDGDFVPDDIALVEAGAAERMVRLELVRYETEAERKGAIARGEPRGPAGNGKAAAKPSKPVKKGKGKAQESETLADPAFQED